MSNLHKPRIWLIDDLSEWHTVSKKTLACWGNHEFTGFHRAQSALIALERCSQPTLPQIILMDYYIAEDRGDRVTAMIRAQFPKLRCCIVGYSTAASGSQAIIQAGGNLALRKHSNQQGINPSLLKWLQGEAGNTPAP